MTPSRRSGRRRGVFAALRHVGDMAIDLGTANTVVYVRGRGIVLSEPSVVAIDERTGEVHAVGSEAQLMIGRTPASISADRPLRHGVIADFEVTEAMLRRFMEKVLSSRFSRPRLVMCAPSGVTEVERRAVEEASLSAGAREVHLIEESLAAAIGAGLPIAEPVGRMVVDIGGGTSEVAVISLGGLVVSRSLRVGGYDLDEAITNHIRNEHRMAIGSQSAEAIKLAIAAATPQAEDLVTEVRGRDLMSGLPREVQLTGEEVQRRDRRAARRHPRRRARDARGDAAGARRRHHQGGHPARGRRRAAARARRAARGRDRHAGARRRRAAGVRRARRRPVARGARPDGPRRAR